MLSSIKFVSEIMMKLLHFKIYLSGEDISTFSDTFVLLAGILEIDITDLKSYKPAYKLQSYRPIALISVIIWEQQSNT